MHRTRLFQIATLVTSLLFTSSCSNTKKVTSTNWKPYLNGLTIEPHLSTDKVTFAKQYAANKDYWDKAFAYLKNTDLNTLPVGKYVIVPDKVTVSVTNDSTKNFEKTNWESHRKVIDIQYVISGEEKMGVAAVTTATVIKPYDDKRDVANYNVEGKYYVSEPGRMFIFFPNDAHRPNITTGKNLPDKKIVIKIPVAQ